GPDRAQTIFWPRSSRTSWRASRSAGRSSTRRMLTLVGGGNARSSVSRPSVHARGTSGRRGGNPSAGRDGPRSLLIIPRSNPGFESPENSKCYAGIALVAPLGGLFRQGVQRRAELLLQGGFRAMGEGAGGPRADLEDLADVLV